MHQDNKSESGHAWLKEEKAGEIQRLHDLVRRSLGNCNITTCSQLEPPVKRRKLSKDTLLRPDNDTTAIPFRLISWSLPAQRISLRPAFHSSVPHQRPTEDTKDEAIVRRIRAREAAIDPACILSHPPNAKPEAQLTASPTLFTMSPGADPLQLPSLILTECITLAAGPVTAVKDKAESNRIKCCPLVPVAGPSSKGDPKRKRRRKSVPRERPPPAFFRPMQEWGGKSAGYAMGWSSSWPAHRPGPQRYVRDTMGKGTLIEVEKPQNLARAYVRSIQ